MSGGVPIVSTKESRMTSQEAEEERKRRRSTRYYTPQNSDVDQDVLDVYYCLHCGTYCLILDIPLHRLPCRTTDGAYALDCQAHTYKSSLKQGPVKLLRREKGVERQYRLLCSGCGLFIAYAPVESLKAARILYILPSSLTDNPNLFLRQVQKGDDSGIPGSIREGPDDNSCRVLVEVTPDQRKTVLTHISDERVNMLVAESSKEDKVNDEMVNYLSMVLGQPRSDIRIETGSKSRSKVVIIYHVSGVVAYDKLLTAVP
mmetsp:Transcript_33018/g.53560  ORF Transcript_33018/g.53560 Transcript_33018/m.53560 type:complete len:259 (+) Transcript_33018:141-917(+)|eukprot:CAMPEP_0184667486 /NCGR_PEP_ID=MMETSP0308-20130426/67670_1 /TAXON_ID=38269 /ORGANISM="Gloeochaete witrockiana, Strain SAG 46.84" /LENGTH=258 /DNA_ID=CAMNT_0027112725 /DNA_START=123 /DNA_END=899 /DNA_ORIENTATION=+